MEMEEGALEMQMECRTEMDAEWMTIGWDPSLDADCLLQSNQAKLESIASEQHGTDGET